MSPKYTLAEAPPLDLTPEQMLMVAILCAGHGLEHTGLYHLWRSCRGPNNRRDGTFRNIANN